MKASREELEKLITDMLAIQTAKELGLLSLPSDADMAALRRQTSIVGSSLLDAYDKTSLISQVKDVIVSDVRNALLKRTRIAQFIGWGLHFSSFIAAIIIGSAQYVFTSPVNIDAIHATFWIVLGLTIANFVGFAYLQYFDRGP